MPARMRSLEILDGGERNLVDREANQEDQKGLVVERSVRQMYFSGPLEVSEGLSRG